MAISTEKLLTLSQFQTGLQAAKNYTDGEITKVNLEVSKKAAQTDLDTTNGKVANLETQMATAQQGITDNETAINNEVTRAKGEEAKNAQAASTAQAAAEAADAKAVKAQEEVDALEIEVATVKGNVATNTNDISTMKSQISALEAGTYDDSEVRGLISDNAEAIEANTDAIEELEQAHATDMQSLQEQIDANANAITVLSDGVDPEKVDGVKDLIDYVDEHGAVVTGMQEDIAQNASDVDALETGKADKATTLAGYGIADAYTTAQADAKTKELIASEVVINVATDEEVTAVINTVFAA